MIQITLTRVQSSGEHWKPSQRVHFWHNYKVSHVFSCVLLIILLEFIICEVRLSVMFKFAILAFPHHPSASLLLSNRQSHSGCQEMSLPHNVCLLSLLSCLSKTCKQNPHENLLSPRILACSYLEISKLVDRGIT